VHDRHVHAGTHRQRRPIRGRPCHGRRSREGRGCC
jgi:hypothetical protein